MIFRSKDSLSVLCIFIIVVELFTGIAYSEYHESKDTIVVIDWREHYKDH